MNASPPPAWAGVWQLTREERVARIRSLVTDTIIIAGAGLM